ncbi:MAG: PAS domain-containing protein, partial [Chloroflexi bacterium]|nr:PAS domain-containing protein [Chloroflexota bacterium]
VSPNWISLTGYPLEKATVDWDFWPSLIVPEDRAAVGLQLERLRAGLSGVVEYRLVRADGEVIWVRDSARALPGSGEIAWMIYGVVSDISVLKLAQSVQLEQERLQIAIAKERELSEVKTHFMSMVSHEFRTPLAMILSAAEMLERYFDQMNVAQRQDKLATIQAQIGHLRTMLDEVALILRAGLGYLEYDPKPVDVVAYCESLLEEVRNTIGQTHVVRSMMPDDLPMVYVDARLLRRILVNLLSNALKYSMPGTLVALRLLRRRGQLCFEISDAGRGIPPEDHERLFDAFFRGSNVEDVGGTGLGLAVVIESVRMHNGSITLESEVGKGSTFKVLLPFQPINSPTE